jgi:hypothetical protein
VSHQEPVTGLRLKFASMVILTKLPATGGRIVPVKLDQLIVIESIYGIFKYLIINNNRWCFLKDNLQG